MRCGRVAKSLLVNFVWNAEMIFLLGLMGVFAVGATALVWYEISSRSGAADTDDEATDEFDVRDLSEVDTEKDGSKEDQAEDQADHIDELLAAAADLASAPVDAEDDKASGDAMAGSSDSPLVNEFDSPEAPNEAIASPVSQAVEDDVADPVVSNVCDDADSEYIPDAAQVSDENDQDTVSDSVDILHGAHQDNVREFRPDHDRLVVVFDDAADAFPVVGLFFDSDGSGRAHVTLNGEQITTVEDAGGLTLEHIKLVPESSLLRGLAA